jgi:hypothetical protein
MIRPPTYDENGVCDREPLQKLTFIAYHTMGSLRPAPHAARRVKSQTNPHTAHESHPSCETKGDGGSTDLIPNGAVWSHGARSASTPGT